MIESEVQSLWEQSSPVTKESQSVYSDGWERDRHFTLSSNNTPDSPSCSLSLVDTGWKMCFSSGSQNRLKRLCCYLEPQCAWNNTDLQLMSSWRLTSTDRMNIWYLNCLTMESLHWTNNDDLVRSFHKMLSTCFCAWLKIWWTVLKSELQHLKIFLYIIYCFWDTQQTVYRWAARLLVGRLNNCKLHLEASITISFFCLAVASPQYINRQR